MFFLMWCLIVVMNVYIYCFFGFVLFIFVMFGCGVHSGVFLKTMIFVDIEMVGYCFVEFCVELLVFMVVIVNVIVLIVVGI